VIATASLEARGSTPASTGADWIVTVDRRAPGLGVTGGAITGHDRAQVFLAGEIVNASELALSAARPAGTPAEVFLADAAPGIAALLPRLRGQFAVAIAERSSGTVRLVRDPLGSHPLFYAVTPRRVVFAAEARILRRLPDVSGDLNRVALTDHLCKRWPDRSETFFSAIHRVPPGWQVIMTPGQIRTERYWNPASEDAPIDWLPDEEVARFDALLDQAVARGLGGGRAGVFLSGGFDSVSVAAVAADLARRANRPMPIALSLGFPDPTCDERAVQTGVARALHLPLHLQRFHDAAGARGLLAEGLALNDDLDAPLFNSWMPAYVSLIREATTAGVTTILTGEGGDEWLGATPFLAADLLRRGRITGLVQMARTWHRSYHQDWITVVRGTLWRYGLRPLVGAACATLAPAWWDDRRADRLMASGPAWAAPDPALRQAQAVRARAALAAARPPGGFYQRESRLFLDHLLNAWLFEEQHAIGRRLGVRYVHPYWDADLVAHVYRVRPERLNEDHRTKALVRQTVARRFPALGFERQRKVAALGFFASILRREGPVLGEAVADFAALGALGIVQPEGARAFMRAAWHRSPQEMGVAWNLISMETWVRTVQGARA
jgi:asparagine synthetase B (glutamine-hydrolysing)